MWQWFHSFFGSPNQRKVEGVGPLVDRINDLEAEYARLSDDELSAKTTQFRQELANRERSDDDVRDGKLEAEVLDLLLPEAFATVREAGKRVLGMRHFDVQLIGGIFLHRGGISEMRTGEGKTLVATLPAYLNALTGRGVHVVTVNDYLAQRDAEWMGQLYHFLGLTTGLVLSQQRGLESFAQKKAAYAADITYGTNNEFGFDYLRDNMATSRAQLCQRPFYYAIVDEVDSILIDEARTPLIISGRLQQSEDTYRSMAALSLQLDKEADYTIDEKAKNVILTEDGIDHAQALLGVEDLFDYRSNYAHHLLQALKAKELFRRDIEYVVKDDEVVIVDEFTGRLMDGRRWSDGLHQAVEAKEGVHIQDETQTLASITFQNLFRLYPKLAGMTGTAMTEEAEFGKIYNLEVTAIPTNRADIRQNQSDIIYKTETVKLFKVVEDIVACHRKGQPVLVGTISIEKSERISQLLSDPTDLQTHLEDKAKRLMLLVNEEKNNIKTKDFLLATLSPLVKDRATAAEAQWLEAAQALEAPSQKGIDVRDDLAEFVRDIAKTAAAVSAVRDGLPHEVLNAKHHEREAMIVAQAGRLGAITIATNMAGRGTDILLGGNPEILTRQHFLAQGLDWRDVPKETFESQLQQNRQTTEAQKKQVVAAGGLHIIGTERHESRRIDNQLRGRAARQGDPGSTRFYLSLEDSLMRLFGGQKIAGLMDMLNVDETMPITAPLVSRAIESAQRKVEAYHFDMRKNILQYDDVLTEQRQLIYKQRRQVLEGYNLRASICGMVSQHMARLVVEHLGPETTTSEDWDEEALRDMVAALHATVPQLSEAITVESLQGLGSDEVRERFQMAGVAAYEQLETALSDAAAQLEREHGIRLLGPEDAEPPVAVGASHPTADTNDDDNSQSHHPLRQIEREILLSVIDAKWVDHLHNLDALREGIGLRAYGQKDPLIEYKRESYALFQQLSFDIQRETVMLLFHSRIQIELPLPDAAPEQLPPLGDFRLADGTQLTEADLAQLPPEIVAALSQINRQPNNEPYVR